MAVVNGYLQGGPCNGTSVTFDFPGAPPDSTNCQDGLYKITRPAQYHNGARIFKYAGPVAGTSPPPGTKGARLHKGWADLQHSMNRTLPAALNNSHRSLSAGLRSIARARKVRL